MLVLACKNDVDPSVYEKRKLLAARETRAGDGLKYRSPNGNRQDVGVVQLGSFC